MAVSNSFKRRFRLAIGSAFRNYNQLAMVVGEGDWPRLDNVQLEKIAQPDELDIVIHKLVAWAERTGNLKTLFYICLEENPTNQELQALKPVIDQLDEAPPPEPVNVSIDSTAYPPPPAELEPEQWWEVKFNAACIVGLAIAGSIWTLIFVEQASVVVFPTLASGLASVVWTMLSEQEKALRLQAIAVRILASLQTRKLILACVAVGIVVSLFVSKAKYMPSTSAPQIELDGESLAPGQSRWLLTYPWGREITPSKIRIGFRCERVFAYPWFCAEIRLAVWPCLVIIPSRKLLGSISTEEDNSARVWTLEIYHQPNPGIRAKASTLYPYRGGPTKVTKDNRYMSDLSSLDSPALAEYPLNSRPRVDVELGLLPGDNVEVKLFRGDTTYTKTVEVLDADVYRSVQVVEISEQ